MSGLIAWGWLGLLVFVLYHLHRLLSAWRTERIDRGAAALLEWAGHEVECDWSRADEEVRDRYRKGVMRIMNEMRIAEFAKRGPEGR